MAQFEFRIAGLTEEELERRETEHRDSASGHANTKISAGGFKLSLGIVTLVIAAIAVIYSTQQERRYISLDDFGEHAATANEKGSLGSKTRIAHALRGDIYELPAGTERLPDFSKLEPIGTIYTRDLNVPTRYFGEGFPGVTDRNEWFAIKYTGTFFVENEGDYWFNLGSDDGSRLFVDGQPVVENDLLHPPSFVKSKAHLRRGPHSLEVQYFQGPGPGIELVLEITKE